LTLRPVDVAKVCSRLFKKTSYLTEPSMKIRVSSAYCRMGKSVEEASGIGNFNRLRSLALFRRD
jgi:hypothetical protein